MPSRTFDAWLAFSDDFDAKRDVAGKYGVDFRTPEPSGANRRTMRMLSEVRDRGPRIMNNNGERFDYLDIVQPSSAYTGNQHYPQKTSYVNSYPQQARQEHHTRFPTINLSAIRTPIKKNNDSPESDTTHSATPRAVSELGFDVYSNSQYSSESNSRYAADGWMNSVPFQGLGVMHSQSPVTPVPPSPSPFSQASERSPLSAHAERPSSFMTFSHSHAVDQQQQQRQRDYFGSNGQMLSSSSSTLSGMAGISSAGGRARAPSAPVYPYPHISTTGQMHSTAQAQAQVGPLSAGATDNMDTTLGRQPHMHALRATYGRQVGSTPQPAATAPPAMMQPQEQRNDVSPPMQTQVGAYGYRYPAYPSFASSAIPGSASLPSLTSGSTASSSASVSSGASAAGDATWARVPSQRQPPARSPFALTATDAVVATGEYDETEMDEDDDVMGGWGRVSEPLPLPTLPTTATTSGTYAAPHAYGSQVHVTPLGFPAPVTQQTMQSSVEYWRTRGAA